MDGALVGCQQIIQYSIHYSLKTISNINSIINHVPLLGQWTRDEVFFKIFQMFWMIRQMGQTKCGLAVLGHFWM